MPVSKRPYATGFFLVTLLGVGALSYLILRPFFEALAWAIVLAVAFRKPWLQFVSRFPKSPLPYGYPVQVMEQLLDYFDYTGQQGMSYALARYFW